VVYCFATQAKVLRKRNLRLQPELGFPLRMIVMHMQTRLLAREEKEPESTRAKNGWCHATMIAPAINPVKL
jgi:hypothetical protein